MTLKETYVHVIDNWLPNYPHNKARVSISIIPRDNVYRISVWSADDTGMIKEYKSKTDTLAMFHWIIHRTDLSQSLLRKRNFEYF